MDNIRIIQRTQESKTAAQQGIQGWKQDVVRGGKALVIGAGALGNELLKNLALIGMGYVLICDMDYIEISNLSRTVLFSESDLGQMKAPAAARRFRELNVEADSRADSFVGNVCTELGSGAFRHVDVVVGCLDNAQARFEANRRCALLGKTFIDAGISSLLANVTVVHSTDTQPCWACSQTRKARAAASMQDRHPCLDAKKDAVSQGHAPTTQVTSALAAALQSQEVVKCLHEGRSEEIRAVYGNSYGFNGWYNAFSTRVIQRRDDCPFHTAYPRVDETEIGSEWTLEQTLDYVDGRYGPGWALTLAPDCQFRVAEFYIKGICPYCGKEIVFNRGGSRVTVADRYCPGCPHEIRYADNAVEKITVFARNGECAPYMGFTLRQLGIPAFHILNFFHVDHPEQTLALEMTADMPLVMPSLTGSRQPST